MVAQAHDAAGQIGTINDGLMRKVFVAFATLAGLSLAINAGGALVGKRIALGGNTDSTRVREIVIGNNVIAAPENTIRLERARRDGIAPRLDLYFHWPELDGYTAATKAAFTNAERDRSILFVTIEEQTMSRDMSGRLAPIYDRLIEKPGRKDPSGVVFYDFSADSGYVGEALAVAEAGSATPFVARCLTGPAAEESLAPCERDIAIEGNLSLTYRFPRALLGEWRALEQAMRAKAATLVQTGK